MAKLREALQTHLGATYQIRQELGGGGMSATFIAEEVALGRSVVIKVLAPELTAGLSKERFEREIHLAARLQHAFIVPLLSAGVVDGSPWYTMPLVQGESLRARIAREGALTATATARVLRDVAEALAYAHAQGVVHRDIKPDNILLSGTHALVTDFGVAKALSASSQESVTRTGIAIGTPAYMAPEQAAGDPATDHRVDLYALGVTAYEMLTGRAMFAQRSPAQLLMAHVAEAPEAVTKLAPATPPELATLVHQLLAKHPNDRPARAQDVADALGQMLTRWTSGELAPAAGNMTATRALALWAAAFAGLAVAAWLGVRWLPIPEWTFPAVMLLMVAGLPVLMLSVWLHRPAKPIATLPSVASSTTVGKLEAIARPVLTFRRMTRAGAVAFGVLVLLAASWAGSRAFGIGPAATLRAQGVVGATDRLFVADFDAPVSDTALGSVLTELLRTEIGRSASIRLVTPAGRHAALVALGRADSVHAGGTMAREVAQRANAKVYLAGGLTQVGSGYLIRATLFETSSGNELAAFTRSAKSADDIIGGIDHIGREIRDKLGASLREVRGDPPLEWAVTPSLAAARAYTQGIRAGNRGEAIVAREHLKRAVATDTEFAMAYRTLSSYAANAGDYDLVGWAAERAFRYRAKLSPVQQHMVEGTYYASPTAYDIAKQVAAYEAVLEENPRSGPALNNLGLAYRRRREFEKSVEVARRYLATDSTSVFANNVEVAFWVAGRRDEAREYARKLSRTAPRSWPARAAQARLALWSLLPDSTERVLAAKSSIDSLTPDQEATIEFTLAIARAVQGKLALARRNVQRAASLVPARDTVLGVSQAVLFRAELLGLDEGEGAAARRLLDSATAARPPGNASAVGYPWLPLAQIYALAGNSAKARALLASFDQRANANVQAFYKHPHEIARGWIAVAEKRYADAIAAFRAADVGSSTAAALGPLGYAYDVAGQKDSAIAVYTRYVTANDTYGLDNAFIVDNLHLVPLAFRRLGELYDAKGDVAHAREYYAKFIELWKDADPELRRSVVDPVRKRLAGLQPG